MKEFQAAATTAPARLSNLDLLEAESVHIIRDAVAQSEHPVMLYSVGKDSSVMLHLARKAFYPGRRRSRCCTSTRRGSSGRCTRSATRRSRASGWS